VTRGLEGRKALECGTRMRPDLVRIPLLWCWLFGGLLQLGVPSTRPIARGARFFIAPLLQSVVDDGANGRYDTKGGHGVGK
jgi:hypothetical protein